MKIFKLLGVALLSLILSFFVFFIVLEVAKHTGGSEQFRAHNPYDLVIKNARIIDGTGGEIVHADIGIRGKVIIKVGKNLKTDKARVFDAAGYTIAPNKVEWPEDLDWVKRDLASGLVRYPENRLLIAAAQEKEWQGKSVRALLNGENIIKDVLAHDTTALAWVAPRLDLPENSESVVKAFYLLSGWRGELLNKNIGKIKEGYPADLVVFNHREIGDEQLLKYLNAEKLPPIQYLIEGSQIQSTKTDS